MIGPPSQIVAVGQFGRTVKEAARRLGLATPPLREIAPGEPIPADGAIILLDTDLSALAAPDGTPALVISVSQDGRPTRSGAPEIAFGRTPDVADAVAILLPALFERESLLAVGAATASASRLHLDADRPRRDCGHLLAVRTAQRLLDPGSAPADIPVPAAWNALRQVLTGGGMPDPAGSDPLAGVSQAYAQGTLPAGGLVAAARAALADLEPYPATIPITAMAAELDRALAATVAAGGLGAGRALVSDALKLVLERDQLDADPFGFDADAAANLAAALDDLDRRARSWSLILTLTRRSALLSGLRLVSEAARQVAARRARLPDREPVVALLESRWARLDEVEDQLARFADAAGSAARNIRTRDYLAALPGGEHAAIEALVHDVGVGPALLSGDLPAFLEGRSARFFTWVPELPLDEQIADLPDGALAVVAGIPGTLAAGQALDLANRLADVAVPMDLVGQIVVVRICEEPRDTLETRVSEPAWPGSGAMPCAPALPRIGAGSDGVMPAPDEDLHLVGAPAYPDEPAAALIAAWDAAPGFRHEALFVDRMAALCDVEQSWLARTYAAGRPVDREPAFALELAWDAAFLWEDRLGVWEDLGSTLESADAAVLRTHVRWIAQEADLPLWYEAAIAEPTDPLGDSADLAAIGLATHLITHVGGYLAYAYCDDNGLIHAAYLAPADDPPGIVAGLLAHRGVLPLLRKDARARLADVRYHDAIRTFAHDLGAEVATRDWLRMPVSTHQRLLAERGLALVAGLPEDRSVAQGVAAPAADVSWDAGVVLPGLGRGAA